MGHLSRNRDWLPKAHQSFVDVDGVRTRCFEAGAGETVVLIHGGQFGSGYSLDSWSLTLEGFSRWCRVVAFDRLGQGMTDNPRSEEAFTARSVLEHADAFLAAKGIDECHLVGHSRGAFVAAWLAVNGRAAVRTLTVADTNTLAPDDPRFPAGAYYRALEQREAACSTLAERVRVEPTEQTRAPDAVSEEHFERLAHIAELAKTRHADEVMARIRDQRWRPSLDAERARLWERIDGGAVNVPTLIVWGDEDESAPRPLADRLFERLAASNDDVVLAVMSRARHYCFRDRPRTFDALVRGHVTTVA